MRFLVSLITAAVFSACAGNSAPNFHVLAPTQNAKWNEPIPANKDVPMVRETYKHRAPFEDGVLYVNGKKVSKMAEPAGTIAHELTHGTNAHLRNLKTGFSGFFVPYHGALYLKNTHAKRVQLAQFIPEELRGIEGTGGRFHDYVQTASGKEPDAGTYFDPSNGKKLWGETDVFYIWDEWNAYLNGGRAYLEAEQKYGKENWDGLTGPMEFLVYSLAGLRAIQAHDKAYSDSVHYQEAKRVFMFFAEETVKLLEEGRESSLSPQKAEAYLERLRFSKSIDALELRRFAQSELGSDWTSEVLGF